MLPLNHREEQILQVLWKLKKAFVKDIIDELDETPPPPYNTVSSIVRKLEKLGHIDHESFGKTHRYFPLIKEESHKKKSIMKLLNDYFGGSPEQLLSYFLKEEKLTKEEIIKLLKNLKK